MNTVECKECGTKMAALSHHIKANHNMSAKAYCEKHNGALLMSEEAVELINKRTARLHSGKLSFDIEKTFGISFDAKKAVDGFSVPFSSTPPIDTNYVFSKDTLLAVLAGLELPDERVFLTGHTGSGKSSVVQQACARLNMAFCRMNCDADITRADFIGQYILKGEQMEFMYGLLPVAMKEGKVLLLDEIDAANPSVSMVLQSVLEKDGKLTIPETGEVITPHANFRIFATGNTKGQGDNSGLYVGTQPQNAAMLDRFTWLEVVNYPEKDIETKIVQSTTGLGKKIATDIVKVATIIRAAFEKGDIGSTMSTRTLINIGNKIKMLGNLKKAYTVSFLNKVDSADFEVCSEAIQRIWGEAFTLA